MTAPARRRCAFGATGRAGAGLGGRDLDPHQVGRGEAAGLPLLGAQQPGQGLERVTDQRVRGGCGVAGRTMHCRDGAGTGPHGREHGAGGGAVAEIERHVRRVGGERAAPLLGAPLVEALPLGPVGATGGWGAGLRQQLAEAGIERAQVHRHRWLGDG